MHRSDTHESRAGTPDADPDHVAASDGEPVSRPLFSRFDYNEASYKELEEADLADCLAERDESSIVWIDVEGTRPPENLRAIGEHFGFHPLAVDAITNTMQRPKMENYGDYILVVLKSLRFDAARAVFLSEQIGLVYGKNFVITFQEGLKGDGFDPIREEIRKEGTRTRRMKADYLAYALMDAVVDNYFAILELLGERIDELEERLVSSPGPEVIREVHRLKRSIVDMRRAVWPLREEIGLLEKIESPVIEETTMIFLRDLYDRTIEVIETVEIYHEILTGMHDTYLSSMSNRMNEIMKVLTIIATIFIPLTFIAGVYGMNFRHMPELEWRWGYFLALGMMAATAVTMLWFFRRRKWL